MKTNITVRGKGNELPELFDKKFDVTTGKETVSFLVRDCDMKLLKHILGYEDARRVLMGASLGWIGRDADHDRLVGMAVRQHDSGRVEIRLQFDPPWYWAQVTDELVELQHDLRDERPATNAGTVNQT